MSGPRRNQRARCAACGVHSELCVCALLPRLDLPFEFLLIQNHHERHKPTNTGRILLDAFARARRVFYAVQGEAFDASALAEPDADFVLLFPRADAHLLGAADLAPVPGRRRVLVVLDGTWGQCSRMSRRVPGLEGLPAFALPPGPPSHWGVRRTEDPARISTFEAAIRVVELSGHEDDATRLRVYFDRLAAAMLFMKGKLPRPEPPEQWPRVSGQRKA